MGILKDYDATVEDFCEWWHCPHTTLKWMKAGMIHDLKILIRLEIEKHDKARKE